MYKRYKRMDDVLWRRTVLEYANHTGCPDWVGYLEGLS